MQKQKARSWYRWLWLSPLLTVPTLFASRGIVSEIAFGFVSVRSGALYPRSTYYGTVHRIAIVSGVLVSALWHLILIIPARDRAQPFVRWHGRQALLLAGVRTAIALAFGLAFGENAGVLLAIPLLLLVWFGGTLWGQKQAARGDCSLMRWSGQEELLSTLRASDEEIQAREQGAAALVEIIRSSRDPEERRSTLAELERRGMVEPL